MPLHTIYFTYQALWDKDEKTFFLPGAHHLVQTKMGRHSFFHSVEEPYRRDVQCSMEAQRSQQLKESLTGKMQMSVLA